MNTTIDLFRPDEAMDGAGTVLFIGRRERLLQDDVCARVPEGARALWEALIERAKPGDRGASTETWLAGPCRVVVGVLPEPCSRHNSPARPHAVTHVARAAGLREGRGAVYLCVDEPAHAFAAVCAVARAFPGYSRKTGEAAEAQLQVRVAVLTDGATDTERIEAGVEGIRLAAKLVDMPAAELDVPAFIEVARDVAARVDAELNVLEGAAAAHAGLGGLWGVGKAASNGPALVVLEHRPTDPSGKTIAWVGKGIVYDTGGVSIKGKTNMPGMKGDMGGAAAVLGAFEAAARLGVPHRVVALLCLAENAVGPAATRPDDILTLYSGRTVEVNNTDAEGRLVVADGVAYAAAHHAPDAIIDLATLTGAQLVSTGRRHAAAVCNDDDLEALAVRAGRRSGDLVHPLPYCPEFFRGEFKSEVADLKNSVKDRMNAQPSCAAQFISEHLGDYEGPWLHLDIAGPSGDGERGTGFGVALLLEMLEEA